MALDIDQSFINTGTATVAANGTAVTGQGTAWAGTVRKGDLFGTHAGCPVRILSVNSNTSLTLAYPWKGPAQSAAPYEIQRTPYDLGYHQALQDLLVKLGVTGVSALADVPLAENNLLYADGPGSLALSPLTAFARGLLEGADADDVAAKFGLPEYLGLVAGPGRICHDAAGAANKQMMSRVRLLARQQMRSFRLVFPNWYVGGTAAPYGELGVGASMTLTASVEYPAGTFTQIKFNGAASGTIPDLANIISDEVVLDIPDGAEFWVRTYEVSAARIMFSTYLNPLNSEFTYLNHSSEYGASGIADKTMGGNLVPNDHSLGVAYGPLAVIGMTTKPSILVLGDSRAHGVDDVADQSIDKGTIARSVGREFAYINAGRTSDQAGNFLASGSRRTALAAYCSHIVNQYGTNDLHNEGASATVVKSRMEQLNALFPNKLVFITTIEPKSSSNDQFATVANQSVAPANAQRVAYNTAVRAKQVAGAAAYFEIADFIESARNSGKWKANGQPLAYTNDGSHASPLMAKMLRDAGVIDPAVFRGALPVQSRFASIEEMRAGAAKDLLATPMSVAQAIEYGGNANGSYAKHPNGMLEVWFSPPEIATPAQELVAYVWTFPHVFAAASELVPQLTMLGATGSADARAWVEVGVYNLSATGLTAVARNNNISIARPFKPSLLCRGRWK